jgi:hypoxanthine phosphoribosyltransferase
VDTNVIGDSDSMDKSTNSSSSSATSNPLKITDTSSKVLSKNVLNYTLYDEIDIENRVFVTWNMFEEAINHIHEKVAQLQQQGKTFDQIYALPRGGLCLGVKLSYILGLPLIVDKNKLTPTTLVVDDCTDSGKTLSAFGDYTTAVMFHKPTSCFTPDIRYEETTKQINFCWESKDQRN